MREGSAHRWMRMKYGRVIQGTFIDRPNRFIANVRIREDGASEDHFVRAHVKNTGRYHKLPYIVEAVRLFLP
jgi:DNA-binding sugar fermentation-stimulating protein